MIDERFTGAKEALDTSLLPHTHFAVIIAGPRSSAAFCSERVEQRLPATNHAGLAPVSCLPYSLRCCQRLRRCTTPVNCIRRL